MLSISFSGWFQCRLARDPDPADEPRGVSGASFALINEPDLDRIIRLQNPVCERTIKGQANKDGAVPKVGVRVDSVSINGIGDPDHPLVGADVDWLDEPKFEGWNNALTREGNEPIHPFHLRISAPTSADGGPVVLLDREDILHRERAIYSLESNSKHLQRRLPVKLEVDSNAVREATGIYDAIPYLEDRRKLLREAKKKANGAEALALQQRINGLEYPKCDWRTAVLRMTLSARMIWNFGINGPDPTVHESLAYEWDGESDWPIEFWMGGWDNDALCGFMKGMLEVPGKSSS